MPDNSANNKRIAKNTAFLYGNMLFSMIVSFVTARIILQTLGVVDYGLNNVVGGVIGLFSIVSAVLNSATSRYLTVELGRGDINAMRKVYMNSLSLYAILCLVIFILGETVGLYIVNYTLSIPETRYFACNILYQTIVVSSLLSLFVVPTGALIIAYEKMDVYAYLGVGQTIAKCIVVLLICISPYDKLISLAVLNFLVIICFSLYKLNYCRRAFSEVYSSKLQWDKNLISSMMGFSFWNLIGSAAYVLRIQGLSILINVFFGAIVNAANAIAYQVNTAVSGFVTNFTTAVNPQITKTYASKEYEQMKSLIYRSGKFTYYLLMLLCFPILFETDFILNLWLGEVPKYTTIMTRLVLIISMVETFTYSIGCAVNATGQVKYYQLVICSIMLMIFPLTWILFELGFSPYSGLFIYLITSITALMARFYFMKKLLGISPLEYTKNVYMHTIMVSIASLLLPSLLVSVMENGWSRFLLVSLVVELSNVAVIWLLGLDASEKRFLLSTVAKILRR